MNRRTHLLIGLAVAAMGAGVVALSFAQGEATVRIVEDVLAAPARYDSGAVTLLGVPQPSLVPLTGAEGVVLRPNPEFASEIRSTTAWQSAGVTLYSTHTLTLREDGDATVWSFSNETRRLPSDPDLALPAVTAEWTLRGVHAFAVQAFDDGDGDSPRVWAVYDGPLKEPLQPKPSQFEGRFLTALPDGTPLPTGALLWSVETYTAGCSSKFLPPEERARLEGA